MSIPEKDRKSNIKFTSVKGDGPLLFISTNGDGAEILHTTGTPPAVLEQARAKAQEALKSPTMGGGGWWLG